MSTATAGPSTGPTTGRASGSGGSHRSRPGLLGALALAAEAADDVIVSTVRDVHGAVSGRVWSLVGPAGAVRGDSQGRGGNGRVSSAVYAGLGCSLRASARGLRAADRATERAGLGGRLEDSPRGRFVVSAVNGLMGDRLAETHNDLAIQLAVRRHGRDVPPERAALDAAFPRATGDLVVFLHGLGESETLWHLRSAETGGSYGARLAADSAWTPVYLRANSGLPIAENGVALAALLDRLVEQWPVDVRRIALVGHSMGGLVMRAACAVVSDSPAQWNRRVSDVVTLGTPHLGAPLERGVALGAKALGWLPESAPFGRILEYRSVGILDLRAGLAPDVQNLPHAKYHLVAATLAGSPRHPVSEAFGDLLVRYPSAVGKPRRGEEMFPGADVLHVKGDHFDLLNHEDVYQALRGWLA